MTDKTTGSDEASALITKATLCVILVPLTVLLHEAAHWMVAHLGGLPATLHYANVAGFSEQAPFDGKPRAVAAATLAGPLVTIILCLVGAKYRDRYWGRPLVAVSIPRFVVNAVFMLQQALVGLGLAAVSEANFDEMTAARALDVAPLLTTVPGAIAFAYGLVWLWRNSRWYEFGSYLLGTGIGMALWLSVLGPKVLP